VNRASTAELEQDRLLMIGRAVEDEAVATRCDAPLLITAPSSHAVAALARRVHAASGRRGSPLVSTRSGALPVDAVLLNTTCSNLIRAAAGGTVLLADVEEMPAIVQDNLLDVLARRQGGRTGAATIRLIAGTTVSLFDCVTAGTFSEELFYRLNVIHLMAREMAA
jgi:two-component system response regulator FlrC